jgi:hypothetical protein
VLGERPLTSSEPQRAEDYLGSLQSKLRREKPAAMKSMMAAQAQPPFHMAEVNRPQNLALTGFSAPPAPAKPVPTPPALAQDRAKSRRDLQQVKALCAEYNNRLPPFKGKDISSQLCNQARLDKELKKVK